MSAFKASFFLLATAVALPAASIFTSANCPVYVGPSMDQITTTGGGAGAGMASCTSSVSDQGTFLGFASANAYSSAASVSVDYSITRSFFPDFSAQATSQDLYTVTFSGGSGNGYFTPCLSANGYAELALATATVTNGQSGPSTFTVSSSSNSTATSCSNTSPNEQFVFLFGVPVTFQILLSATENSNSVFSTNAQSEADFLLTFNVSNPSATWLLAEVPEPAISGFLGATLLCMAVALRRKRH